MKQKYFCGGGSIRFFLYRIIILFQQIQVCFILLLSSFTQKVAALGHLHHWFWERVARYRGTQQTISLHAVLIFPHGTSLVVIINLVGELLCRAVCPYVYDVCRAQTPICPLHFSSC